MNTNSVKAVAYFSGIPTKNNNPEKPQILHNFLEGVKKCGDNAVAQNSMKVIDADVALIQGFVHEDGKTLPHLQMRKNAFEHQIKRGKRALIVDSNLFLYADKGNTKRYLRYSYDGVFPTTGFYFDQDIDPTRWQKLSNNLGISLKPWNRDGEAVLVCLQRNGGWSMRGYPVLNWLDDTVKKIRRVCRKSPIIVRLHPGDKKMPRMINLRGYKNVHLSRALDIREDFKRSFATVLHNSSPAVASAIEGVPVFLTDPNPEYSQAKHVANTDLNRLTDPILPDRQDWIERLAMCHWNFDELKSGEAWQFFKKYIT